MQLFAKIHFTTIVWRTNAQKLVIIHVRQVLPASTYPFCTYSEIYRLYDRKLLPISFLKQELGCLTVSKNFGEHRLPRQNCLWRNYWLSSACITVPWYSFLYDYMTEQCPKTCGRFQTAALVSDNLLVPLWTIPLPVCCLQY